MDRLSRIYNRKLSLATQQDELSSLAAGNRHQRNRSLKKSAAVNEDEPSTLLDFTGQRRAASFDTSQQMMKSPPTAPSAMRPLSFDASRGRMSAFSPIDVPRLLVQSPNSPLNVERALTPDQRLLTVPSPDFARKSPLGCESPKNDYLSSLGLQPLLGHLAFTAMAQAQLNVQAMEIDPPKPSILNPLHAMGSHESSSSFDMTSSLDIAGPSGLDTGGSFGQMSLLQQMLFAAAVQQRQSRFYFGLPFYQSYQHGHASSATAEILATMPPKAIIQDDIRTGHGRFQLVRKRGRSEVWNLFGQVLDTQTNVRLPYVACYACKVLYTDTGGGTGNMTRHRCPLGVSYRSSNAGAFSSSSTETLEAGQSSFESISATRASVDAKPPLSVLITQDSGSSNLVSQNSGEISIGEMDLTDTVVRTCAQDMLDPSIFSGKGFRHLFERIWQLAKRAGSNSMPQDFLPDSQMISSALQSNLRFCTDDLKNELSHTSQGVCLTVEGLSYNGRDYKVVHCSRISPDWKWRSNILGVFKAKENQSLVDIYNHVVTTYDLDRALLRITSSRSGEDVGNVKTFVDVKEKLREILLAILTTSTVPILPMITTVGNIVRAIAEADIRLPFDCKHPQDDVFLFHQLLSDWNEHVISIEHLIQTKCSHLLPAFNSVDAQTIRDLQHFLDPFKDTVESLAEDRPNFQKVLPEWYALLHECQPSDEESSPLLRDLKTKATELLTREKDRVITIEHRIAAILNPRLNRRLSPICSDHERQQACDQIRSMSGIRQAREPISRGSSTDSGEPHRKRRMFLDALEDDSVGNDELECYLRSQFATPQTKDIMTFWGTVGQAQFPLLANLARRILAVPATAQKTPIDTRLASVASDQLHTFLMLRSMFEDESDRPLLP